MVKNLNDIQLLVKILNMTIFQTFDILWKFMIMYFMCVCVSVFFLN